MWNFRAHPANRRLFHQPGDPDSMFTLGAPTPGGEVHLKASFEVNEIFLKAIPPDPLVSGNDTRPRAAGSFLPVDNSGTAVPAASRSPPRLVGGSLPSMRRVLALSLALSLPAAAQTARRRLEGRRGLDHERRRRRDGRERQADPRPHGGRLRDPAGRARSAALALLVREESPGAPASGACGRGPDRAHAGAP